MEFEVLNRFTGAVQFTAEIDCAIDAAHHLKLGLSVKWALNNKASLCGADLCRADLYGASLCEANLHRANLYGANLCEADLYGANLWGADLYEANLYGANLWGANLYEANLYGANLWGGDLRGAKEIPPIAMAQSTITPEGQLIGWKKCKTDVIVKLSIPADAKRSNATGRKCRAEFADCLEVFGDEFGVSEHDDKTEYHPGQRIACDNWCEDRWQECAGGIHFFLTREEAEAY